MQIEEQQLSLIAPECPIPEKYKIINIVAMGTLTLTENCIDFAKIEAIIPVKHPKYFPCVMFKVYEIPILVFKNGKIILTGVKDLLILPRLKAAINDILLAAGIKFTEFIIEVQNLVVMTNLNCRINLELTCLTMENCIYEPEQFPAAIIKRFHGQRGTFLVFSNSKIIYLGCNSSDNLDITFNDFVRELYGTGLVE